MPNPQEVATLVVAGRRFDNWESVWVQIRWTEPFPHFRFTTADIVEVPDNWEQLQFKPGDECAIYLGYNLALAGIILSRQTAYAKDNKGVQLYGVGLTWYAARASVMTTTGNFDGKTFEQVAHEVVDPTGIKILPVGVLNATPYKKLQNQVGETIWSFLERIARVRGIVMGSDENGNFLMIDNHTKPVNATIQEGVNIIRCQATISIENWYSDFIVRGQTAASDDQNGPAASEQEAHFPGTAARYSPLLTPAEQPVWNIAELQERAAHEANWNKGTIINVTVVLQGWFNPSTNQLWRAGDDVYFVSPMAMLKMVLKIATVTFSQDRASGTLTTLELVAPWLLKDVSAFNVGTPGSFDAPDAGDTPAPPATGPAEPPAPTIPGG